MQAVVAFVQDGGGSSRQVQKQANGMFDCPDRHGISEDRSQEKQCVVLITQLNTERLLKNHSRPLITSETVRTIWLRLELQQILKKPLQMSVD